MAIEKFAQGSGPGGGLGNKNSCKIASPLEYQEVPAIAGRGQETPPEGSPFNKYPADSGNTPFYNFDPTSSQGIGIGLETPWQPAGALAAQGSPGPPSGTGAKGGAGLSSPFVPAFGK